MRVHRKTGFLALLLGLAGFVALQGSSLEEISRATRADIALALEELSDLQSAVADEKVPIVRRLDTLETEVLRKRAELARQLRTADNRRVELSGLESELEGLEEENRYISDQLAQYVREFEDRIHIGEVQRYRDEITAASEAAADPDLEFIDKTRGQLALLDASLGRIESLLGSDSYEGRALTPAGILEEGRFVVSGPVAVFASRESGSAGLVRLQLGSPEPSVVDLGPGRTQAIRDLVGANEGGLPVDPSLGNALKIAATRDNLIDHMKKGGPVMIPIVGLGLAAMLIALVRFVSLSGHRLLGPDELQLVISYIRSDQTARAKEFVAGRKGIVHELLGTAIENCREGADYLEEILYEKMLAARPGLERLLPFIALTAAAAPLLGLLGTVTGMIRTFNMITVFGTGDAAKLSSGISEALITTKFGLVVAVPALICHAIVSRKAKGILGNLELVTVGFINSMSFIKGSPEAGDKSD